MSGWLPCNETCPDGRLLVTPAYCPNPLITHYKRMQVPWKNINPCPTYVGHCHPFWLFRAHGFDAIFDINDVPNPNKAPLNAFARNPATLAKVEVSWYEYSSNPRQPKGDSLMAPGPIPPQPGKYDGRPLINQGTAVVNRIICDIGNGVNINIPPSGRINAEILLPDLTAFTAAGNVLPQNGLPTQDVGMTRITPSGFLTEFEFGYPSARYTQSVYVETGQGNQNAQQFQIPPLVKSISAYRADADSMGAPQIDLLFKEDPPLDVVLSQHILLSNVAPLCGCPVPENAEAIRVSDGGYTGIVTIVLELDL